MAGTQVCEWPVCDNETPWARDPAGKLAVIQHDHLTPQPSLQPYHVECLMIIDVDMELKSHHSVEGEWVKSKDSYITVIILKMEILENLLVEYESQKTHTIVQ